MPEKNIHVTGNDEQCMLPQWWVYLRMFETPQLRSCIGHPKNWF